MRAKPLSKDDNVRVTFDATFIMRKFLEFQPVQPGAPPGLSDAGGSLGVLANRLAYHRGCSDALIG